MHCFKFYAAVIFIKLNCSTIWNSSKWMCYIRLVVYLLASKASRRSCFRFWYCCFIFGFFSLL